MEGEKLNFGCLIPNSMSTACFLQLKVSPVPGSAINVLALMTATCAWLLFLVTQYLHRISDRELKQWCIKYDVENYLFMLIPGFIIHFLSWLVKHLWWGSQNDTLLCGNIYFWLRCYGIYQISLTGAVLENMPASSSCLWLTLQI